MLDEMILVSTESIRAVQVCFVLFCSRKIEYKL